LIINLLICEEEVISLSKGETKIVDILNRERVRFDREKTFSDLKHGKFRFDFLIHLHGGDCIVEFNGE
jgi:hypothetical protein